MTPSEILKALGLVYYAPNFSSPEGQQKIRNRVRELAHYQDVVYVYAGMDIPRTHYIAIVDSWGEFFRGEGHKYFAGWFDTESAAWLAALEFLTKEE